jgi:hypothetical protein
MRAAFNNSQRTLHLFVLVILFVLLATGLSEAQAYFVIDHHGPVPTVPERPLQEFHCHTGYSLPECQHQVAILRRVLQRINGDAMGPWTWVLVRSEDWKPLLRRIGTRLDTPAFSSLQQRETFLEGALFGPEPLRAAELAREFQVPINQLLELAVAHEMGHAICHGGDEGVANRVGQQLRQGRTPACNAFQP